jgi:hypothetical protein
VLQATITPLKPYSRACVVPLLPPLDQEVELHVLTGQLGYSRPWPPITVLLISPRLLLIFTAAAFILAV